MKRIIYRKYSDFTGAHYYMGRRIDGKEYGLSVMYPASMSRIEVAHRLRVVRRQLRKIIRQN